MSNLRVAGLGVDEQGALDECLDQLKRKRPRNLLRAGLYDGKHAVTQMGSVIPPEYYKTAIVLGWPAKAVDMPARRLNVDGFTWPDGDLDGLGIGALIEDNRLRSELSQAFTSTLLHGVAFAIASNGLGDEPAGMIHFRDAMNTTGLWDVRRRRLSVALSVNGWDNDVDHSFPSAFTLYFPDLTVTCERSGSNWVVDRVPHSFGMPVEPLTYKPRLGRPFGMSRISRPVISAYRAAVRTAIRMEGNADIYSFPQLVLLGASADVFRNPDGTMRPAWQVALGRVFALEDDEEAVNPRATVQRFEAASPEPHLKMLRQQAELFAGETSIPMTSLGVTGDGNPTSAESYLASREDMVADVEGAADDMTPGISRTVQRALAMANGLSAVPDDWASIGPKWRPFMYQSRAAAADAGAKQLAAVPWLAETEVGLELLGLSDSQIERAVAERRRVQGQALGMALTQAVNAPVNAPGDASQAPAQAGAGDGPTDV